MFEKLKRLLAIATARVANVFTSKYDPQHGVPVTDPSGSAPIGGDPERRPPNHETPAHTTDGVQTGFLSQMGTPIGAPQSTSATIPIPIGGALPRPARIAIPAPATLGELYARRARAATDHASTTTDWPSAVSIPAATSQPAVAASARESSLKRVYATPYSSPDKTSPSTNVDISSSDNDWPPAYKIGDLVRGGDGIHRPSQSSPNISRG